MTISSTTTAALLLLLLISVPVYSEPLQAVQPDRPVTSTPDAVPLYFLEISVSRNLLMLFETKSGVEKIAIAQYPVGTAVRGLKIYPLGKGKVTGIYFNPWWYPTPYSRQVFRGRGIELPAAVPPGHPLNYMGPFKIALSHRTSKGAVYRIHGNNNPKRVGQRVTGGCFVMDNADGLSLARRIRVGTEVNIVP